MSNPLRKLNRKLVRMHHATHALEMDEPGTVVEALIQRVRIGPITAKLGAPPRLFNTANMQPDDMTDEEWAAQQTQRMLDDPGGLEEGFAYTIKQQNITIQLGLLEVTITNPEGKTASYPLGLDATNENTVMVDDLGDDYETIYNAIVEFSSIALPLLGGGEAARRFPDESKSNPGQSDSEILRDTAEPTPN